ncbi:hypothetical protein WJX81_008068 [Elliptochloris bilobata]|uniref:CPC1/SPEF2 domain-containing protein n=1 Tax=Elliptochloris bilobata TaxID=381761 RepID=A0AAW1RR04_9CHLO
MPGQQAELEALAAALAGAAAGEAALIVRLSAVAGTVGRMQEARVQREREYTMRREAAWQAALEEEGRRLRSLATEHAAAADRHAQRWADAQAARALLRDERRTELAGAVAEQMVCLGAHEAVYCRLADGAPPPRHVRREWVALFTAGALEPAREPLTKVLESSAMVEAARTTGATAAGADTNKASKAAYLAGDKAAVWQGFVLDGWPMNAREAAALERGLTGLDLQREGIMYARAPRLAPPPHGWLPDPFRPLTSGLDAVIACELDARSILSRAAGTRLDPKTGQRYNLALNPPAGDDPGLAARLQELPCASEKLRQLQARLSAHEAAAPLLAAWLERFPGLRSAVDTSEPAAEAAAACSAVAFGVLAAKAAAKEAHAAAGEAAGALLLIKQAELQAASLLRGSNAASLLKARAHGGAAPSAGEAALAVVVVQPLAPMIGGSAAAALQEQYRDLEAAYIDGMAGAFAQLIVLRKRQLRHFAGQRSTFLEYLRRPAPDKDAQVAQFVSAWEAVDADLRGAAEVRAEQALRSREARDALWELCDSRLKANEERASRVR